ncbi:MAG: hypothetical protein AMK70_04510 [Nitrospira bacterium SG8_35_1]|nr:MAG: hypothetical protein AMK70_04510 [Nitrospira bacterium SG8_35_1]
MKNPFYFRELPLNAPFCDRQTELAELLSHAENRANVVLYSPRRYGKTSIVKRVQNQLGNKSLATVYVDFFGVDSIEDMMVRLASRVYKYSHSNESLFKKMMRFLSSWRPVVRPDPEYGASLTVEPATKLRGVELLEETLTGLGKFISDHKKGCHIVFDEFQEIVELKESAKIEGILRSHIQTHSNASYFFVGSRRTILNAIFNDKKRPFFRSAIGFNLEPLPYDEATDFIIEQFKKGGKACPEGIARKITETVKGYPYYIQRVPYSIYEISEKKITDNDYFEGFKKVLDEERQLFEAMIRVLAIQQIKLTAALAIEPTPNVFAAEYIHRYNLGSIGGIQGTLKKLLSLDYIEKTDKEYHLVDPVFAIWLRNLKGY